MKTFNGFYELDESCTQCDSCGTEMRLDDIVIDPTRGCICGKCSDAFLNQELMEEGIIDWRSHCIKTMKGE